MGSFLLAKGGFCRWRGCNVKVSLFLLCVLWEVGGYFDCCFIGLTMLLNHPQESQLVTDLTETWASHSLFVTSKNVFFFSFNVPSLATSCPCAWQKHVLPANQNSKFWKSNFEVYLPTLKLFGATSQTFEGKQSRSAMHSGILCLEFWKSVRMNETPVFDLDAYSTFHKKSLTHILPLGRCELCDFVHSIFTCNKQPWPVFPSAAESCIFYLGRGFFKFFSFEVCFVTFRLFLPLFLYEPFTCAK